MNIISILEFEWVRLESAQLAIIGNVCIPIKYLTYAQSASRDIYFSSQGKRP